MKSNNKHHLKNTIWGALVADAASVGFHWLYDQRRIQEIAPESPEFHAPNQEDYENVPGFFAHGHKKVGEFSQYGEQAMVLLRSLASNGGRYDKTHYENLFQEHFGYGGRYVGYIDHPTRDTLNNIARAEHDALTRAESIPFDGDSNSKHMMVTKVLANIRKTTGEELRRKIEEAVRQTHDDDNMVAYAFKITSELESMSAFHGADDEQLPAISKLPALVAIYAGEDDLQEVVESAVRVTNDNDLAVLFGLTAASIIEAAIQHADPEKVFTKLRDEADPVVARLIDEALLLRNQDIPSVTSQFGMSCNLVFGFPSVVHNLVTTGSYPEAVRQNIYAGGDSCGRAILLGSVLGATYGVGGKKGIPNEWLEKVILKDEVNELLRQLFD